jgi:hypothetical protein
MGVLIGFIWSSFRLIVLVSESTLLDSRHADNAHHSAFLMVEDVTVKHPVAGIVGDTVLPP